MLTLKKLPYVLAIALAFVGAGVFWTQFIIVHPLPFHLSDDIHVFWINTFNVTRRVIADAIIALILFGLFFLSWKNYLLVVNVDNKTTFTKK